MTPVVAHNPPMLKRTVNGAFDPAAVIVTFSQQPGAFALESVCDTSGYGRYSIFGCRAVHSIEMNVTHPSVAKGGAFDLLAEAIETQSPARGADEPCPCGWYGWIPYEMGAAMEGVHRIYGNAATVPRMRFSLYDTVAVHDRTTGVWEVCAVESPHSTRPAVARLDECVALLQSSATVGGSVAAVAADSESAPVDAPTPNMSRRDYFAKVDRAIRYIEAGDIYQVNLTQQFTTPTALSPLELYLRLRRRNPAAFAAYLPCGDQAIISSSPELFLDVSPDGHVVTRPIKGTRPRSGNPHEDAVREVELVASEKDRAELNMIIDLLRNDLGRVCEFGSVCVLADHDVEWHPTVLHLVATIEGRLRPSVSPIDLLKASFPGGSITGCPKIRAMQIINELEPTPRDVYCGSIGYIGLDGGMKMNIAIRTMLYDNGLLRMYAGGAITADSDPEAEYRETLAKAEGMFRALGRSAGDLDFSTRHDIM
jgi:para-aminobenzoate synthetase component 1